MCSSSPSRTNNLLQLFTQRYLIEVEAMAAGATIELGSGSRSRDAGRGAAVLDFILRVVGIVATLASAIAMGSTNESLPFFTRFIRFKAKYSDLPTFTFFVAANAVVCAYLVLSLALSVSHIMRSGAQKSRVVLIFFDAAMLALLTAGASAAAAIVYLAHKGNTKANWFAICQQFNSFCERISGCLVGSFGGVLVFVLLILLSAATLSRRP